MDYAAIASVKSALKDGDSADRPMPDVRRLIGKSALLSLGVVVSALVIAALTGPSEEMAVAVLTLMMILLILVCTFLTALFVLIVANFQRLARLLSHRTRQRASVAGDLADEWLDGSA